MSERKPLTLEELRKMKGEPVWIDLIGNGLKTCRIVLKDSGTCFVTVGVGGLCLMTSDYGLKWIAYADKPIHIDRSAWEPCEECKEISYWDEKCDNCKYDDLFANQEPCASCESKSKWEPCYSFCPTCGRPLTDAAWDMLEKRLESAK